MAGSLRPTEILAPAYRLAALAAALTIGALIAGLPVRSSAALAAGGLALGLALWQPAAALGLAIILGPARAYLAAAGYHGPLYDLGQIFFALALTGWLARGALRREISLPRLGLMAPLVVFITVGASSLIGAAQWRDGLNEVIKWAEVAAVMVIAHSEARGGRQRWLIAAVLASGALQAGLGLWQYALRGVGPVSFRLTGDLYRAYGTFEQPNPFGGFLGLIWPVAIGLALAHLHGAAAHWRDRSTFARRLLPALAHLALGGVILAGLYVSFSRGAWLGAAAAAVVMAMFLPRRLALGVGLVLGGLLAGWALIAAGLMPAGIAARLASLAEVTAFADVRGVNINDANFAIVERLAHWQAALAMARDHPWLGVGLGNYASAYPAYALFNWPFHLGHAHNIYLHMLAETGIIGLSAYVSLWMAVFIYTLRTVRKTTGLSRGLALGWLGVWAHLAAHHVVDNLHVNNSDLLIAVHLGLLHAVNTAGSHVRE